VEGIAGLNCILENYTMNADADMGAPLQLAPDVLIETVALDDIPDIVEIDLRVTGEKKADFWYGCYARQTNDPKCQFLVARRDGEVAGFTIGAIQAWEFGSRPCGWVEVITVSPSHRNAHVATRLFESLKTYFQNNDIDSVRTMIHIDDQRLMSFFRMQGMAAGPYIELEMHVD
jgi:GNAT superfamily N-acetyltransferase